MQDALQPLLMQFLEWIDARPRTYPEVMEAWRTSCPRLTIWEDALAAGLVSRDDRSQPPTVTLTPYGQSALKAAIHRESGTS